MEIEEKVRKYFKKRFGIIELNQKEFLDATYNDITTPDLMFMIRDSLFNIYIRHRTTMNVADQVIEFRNRIHANMDDLKIFNIVLAEDWDRYDPRIFEITSIKISWNLRKFCKFIKGIAGIYELHDLMDSFIEKYQQSKF